MVDPTTRRRVLCAAATLPTVALAGCTSEPVADDDPDDHDDEPTASVDDDAEGWETGDDSTSAQDTSDGNGLPTELPTDPQPEDFVDRRGEDTVEVLTREGLETEPTFVFDPPFVRVDAGAIVRWVNDDGIFHTITSTPTLDQRSGGGTVFDASIAAIGDAIEWEATPAGEQQVYYCSPHASFMFGAIDIV